MAFFSKKILIIAVFPFFLACSSKDGGPFIPSPAPNPEVPTNPEPSPTPSPQPTPGPSLAPLTGVSVSKRTSRSISVSWNENFEQLDPGVFVRVSTCNIYPCSLETYSDYNFAYGNSIVISGLNPGTKYNIKLRAEKSGVFSPEAVLEGVSTLDSPINFILNYSNSFTTEDRLYSSQDGEIVLPETNKLYSSIAGFSPTYLNDFIILPVSNSANEKRLLAYNENTKNSTIISGNYSISSNSSHLKILPLSDLVFSKFAFIADNFSSQTAIFSVSNNFGSFSAEERFTPQNLSESLSVFGRAYFIADGSVTGQSLYSLNLDGSISEILTSRAGFKLKNFTVANFAGYVLEYNQISGETEIYQIDLLSNSVSALNSGFMFDQNFGLKVDNSNIISKAATGEFYIFNDFLDDYFISGSNISDVTIENGTLFAIDRGIEQTRLVKQTKSQESASGQITILESQVSDIIGDNTPQQNSYFLLNDRLYYVSKNIQGKGILSSLLTTDLSSKLDISDENLDDVSNSGILFSADKIFYTTNENRLISIKNNLRKVEVDLSGQNLYSNNLNFSTGSFLKTGASFVVGLKLNDLIIDNKEKSIFVIGSDGTVSPLIQNGVLGSGEFQGINFILERPSLLF